MSTVSSSDIDALKARLRSTWIAGDFGVIARIVEGVNEEIVARLDIGPGTRVLDVACGTGNSAIPAARRGADVTGIDIAPNLLEQARARAKEARVTIRFEEGDAEQIVFPDSSFDFVISIYGAMFAPRPDLVAAELKRVCRSGGKIVMGNWTPSGFVGQTFKLSSKYVPPPAGMAPPVLWGDEATVRERFKDGISNLKLTPRIAVMRLPFTEAETVEHFRKYFGPTMRTFEALDAEGQAAYQRDLEALWKQHNRATDGTVRVESEFLEVVATKA
jgi:ubiquinone/menaquinone biosynthesis C-methylase UbiE